jgi:tetratricopeptide (TPR) repeat protein
MGRVAFASLLVLIMAAGATAQPGRATGVVKDETGEPIKGATVRAENPVGVPRSYTASTDDKGRFNLIGLRPGQWTFTAEAPGYESQAASLRVQAQGMPTQPLLFSLTKTFGGPIEALGSVAPKDLQAELAEADQLFNSGELADAVSAYRRILQRIPALSAINLQLGAIYREQKNYDAAIEAYNALLAADPGNAKALVGLAATNLERGQLDAAEAPLAEAASRSSAPDRDVLCMLGDVRAARGDAAGARTWYERAAAADPYWGRPVYRLGKLALDQGDASGAAVLMRKVIEIDPRSPEAVEAQAALAALQR